ncbi:hypothetical protein BpHYR1_005230 [Brachionus plicatilis]|uniref:Uncharacterized protein n=1 Tax=Brachionus plicatilis TaxID=10195 RepID=A0A3M7SA37_BRAPC|nr:hypothetical protein BpHYR1_005230 [Brachionus plicatilis]
MNIIYINSAIVLIDDFDPGLFESKGSLIRTFSRLFSMKYLFLNISKKELNKKERKIINLFKTLKLKLIGYPGYC